MALGITSKKKSASVMFEAGTYPGTLTEVRAGERRKYKEDPDAPDEMQPAIFFIFHLDEKTDGEGMPIELVKKTGTSNYWGSERFPKRSGLVDFVCSISPKAFNREECEGNDELFEKRVKMLEGRKFYLTVSPNAKGTYMNIMNAMLVPATGAAPVAAPVAPAPKPAPAKEKFIDLDDPDSIPF